MHGGGFVTAAHPAIARLEQDLQDRLTLDLGREPTALMLAGWVRMRFARISELGRISTEFESRYQAALDDDDRQRAILGLARRLGASERQLVGDAKAFVRYFDRDAVVERVQRRVGEEERAAQFGLDQLGRLGDEALDSQHTEDAVNDAWNYSRDPRLREAGFRCLRLAVERSIRLTLRETLLGPVQRAALQASDSSWVQCEALTILCIVSPLAGGEVIRRRLAEPQSGDDLFVRRHAVRLACRHFLGDGLQATLVDGAVSDPSPAVRQCLAAELCNCDPAIVSRWADSVARDSDPKVRAMLLTRCIDLATSLGDARVFELLRTAIEREQDGFVLRTAFHSAIRWARQLPAERAEALSNALEPAILAVQERHEERKVRGWASAAAEQLWCLADTDNRALADGIRSACGSLREGRTIVVPGLAQAAERDPARVGRVLAVLAQDDFGFELVSSGRLRRGDLIVFRSWRALHEWRHPNSDKRQAFRHCTGRVWRGQMIAPSAIMAELAPTKVPGEPLFQPEEGNWRPWLPLPDMILSTIDTGAIVSLYTPDGVTSIEPPIGFFRRLRARLRLSRNFAEIADLRNWVEKSGRPPSLYSHALRRFGVQLTICPHPGRTVDPHVARFFSFSPAALLAVPQLWEQAALYFSSLYANTLSQLTLFLLVTSCWFFFNHLARNRAMRRARAALPLVVGGWGTRGKSGTERLKAALFSAMGYPFVSKTTGNEAMFLNSPSFGVTREMFLFRPYDKATIWEQLNLVVLAHKLGARVFLWECMGLTPSYVKVLQRHWTRDDIATITNTYPDHEDVQGPAGRNIPEVMTNFIPQGRALITSEEQMRPILIEAAKALDTSFAGVGWLEAQLIPDEFLSRFPYEEHPYNIALVTAMAGDLGISPDVAVKEMADRVVQDIGALKIYPEARVRTRRLKFALGNSANERFGALGNWARLGFDRHDPVAEPDLWITTVINNRADRVPRSRVFASIIVNDISADRHVLIGSNLEGFQGFVDEAWNEFSADLTLWPPDQASADPLIELEKWAKRLRVVHRPEQLKNKLSAMLGAQPDGASWIDRVSTKEPEEIIALINESGLEESDAIVAQYEEFRRELVAYQRLEALIGQGVAAPDTDQHFRDQGRHWFKRKIVVIDNYYASGEEIVRKLVEWTPPGFRNLMMGMQNIKGTGLDFVYRWHAWEACHRACTEALSEDPEQALTGLQALAAFREYGILSAAPVRDALDQLRSRPTVAGEIAEGQINLIAAKLDEQLAGFEKSLGADRSASSSRWVTWLEAFLDPGDAVRRRRKADLIYRDLAEERISSERAVYELKKLTTRQKGGWLAQELRKYRQN